MPREDSRLFVSRAFQRGLSRLMMKRFFVTRFSRGALFSLPIFACAILASTRANAADARQSVEAQIERGRVLLGLRDARAVVVLRLAAQTSLDVLRRFSTAENPDDFAAPRESAARVSWRRALLDGLDAHRWLADSQIAARDNDAAIETLATTLQLAKLENENANGKSSGENASATQARAKLQTLLPDGAARASSATLQRLARFFYEVPEPQIEDFTLPEMTPQRFAFFDAPLMPHGESSAASTRSAPLYRAYESAALPPSLQMNRAVFAYRTEGETRWELVARVFYASRERTENARDDAPRARFLASRFVKIAALQRALWGLENRETTSIWLLENKADWPQKTAVESGENNAQNFRAGGWIESAPSHIFLFRAAVPRSDFGWTRQLMHEYSHVVWPRFEGFTPPLEPFGAGLLGETLLAAQLAKPDIARAFCDEATLGFSDAKRSRDAATRAPLPESAAADFLAAARAHVESNALAALRFWNVRGPHYPADETSVDSLRWTQGLAVFIERASGNEMFSQVLQEAKRREYSQEKSAAPALLISCYESVLGAQWKANSRLDFQLFRDDFAGSKTSPAKTGARFSRWIYLPPNATSLEIAGRVSPSPTASSELRLWLGDRAAKARNATEKGGDFVSHVALEKRDGGWRKLEMQPANAQFFAATIR